MITVHKFTTAWGQSDLSPFVVKLETYLRMAGIEYQGVPGELRRAPKGKLPFIEHEGRVLGDSTLIIDYLEQRYGSSLDRDLVARDRAAARAFQTLLEEQFYFVILYLRWQDDRGWAIYQPRMRDFLRRGGVPAALSRPLTAAVRWRFKDRLHGQGMGRYTREEVDSIGKRIVKSVSDWLGDRPYFMGQKPATIDATIYAFLASLFDTPIPSEIQGYAESLPNLPAYVERMKRRYWSTATAQTAPLSADS